MAENREPLEQLSPLKRALLELREMRTRLEELERAPRAPIAVIGLGCRFPGGGNDPEAYWRLLRDGVDAVSEVPAERWAIEELYDPDPDAPGKMSTRYGGFLAFECVADFDAAFFSISQREALSLDPQQRLLMEVASEALEHAGQPADRLVGSRTGVFIGISTADYLARPSTPTWPQGTATVWPRADCPTSSGSRALACQWIRPARRRWSRSTSPARACAWASAPSPWREA